MVEKNYCPDRGDIIWLDFNPQAGHEQAGRRPALVISPKIYNSKIGLCLLCPIISKVKGYPFEVVVSGLINIKGVVLSDQLKSLDWRIRRAEFIAKASPEMVEEVIALIHTLTN
jgi:mRNA interferase MazF